MARPAAFCFCTSEIPTVAGSNCVHMGAVYLHTHILRALGCCESSRTYIVAGDWMLSDAAVDSCSHHRDFQVGLGAQCNYCCDASVTSMP